MEPPKTDPTNAATISDTDAQNAYVPLAHDAPVDSSYSVDGVSWKKVGDKRAS
jgi:hypothetical protein